MSASITLDDSAILGLFDRLEKAGGDVAGALDEIGVYLTASTQQRFLTKTDPDGRGWVPWAPSTAKARARSGKGDLLRLSQDLFRSITHVTGPRSVKVGTDRQYGAIHQFGGVIEMPPRQRRQRFKYGNKGAARDRAGNPKGSRLRFAKASDRAKSVFEQDVSVPAYKIAIPARPYLGFSDADLLEISRIVSDRIARAQLAGGAA